MSTLRPDILERWLVDPAGTHEALMDQHRREREVELWLLIQQVDILADLEQLQEHPNRELLEQAESFKRESLKALGLPPNTDTRKYRLE